MNIEFTDLIVDQAKTLIVMAGAGVLTESLWQIKTFMKGKYGWKIVTEGSFWAAAAVILCMFLYYCAFGRPSLYAAAGFFAGLLLWKKICCGIINNVWVENEEAENLKTTARSSTSTRPESRGWKKGGQKRLKKKKE